LTYETHQQNTGTKEIDVRRRITTFIILLAITSTSLSEAKAEVKTFPCTGGTYSVEMPAAVLTKSNGCTGGLDIDPSVKSIGFRAFADSEITSITIPNSVTSIGRSAFENSVLNSVVIPNSVTEMGSSAFADSEISSVTISNSIKKIETFTFAATKNLTSVIIPAGVNKIDAYAFSGSGLTSMTIPNTVTDIEIMAFSKTKLTKIEIPDSTRVDRRAFGDIGDNPQLKSIIYCGFNLAWTIEPTCPAKIAAAEKAAAEKVVADAKAAADRAAADAATRAAQDAKKLTITCTKGKVKKKVTGEIPKCPKGYKNLQDVYLTFQAFSNCKLYKKDSYLGGVTLEDGGKTLTFSGVGKYTSVANAANFSDFDCALAVLKVPAYVKTQIETTRALDGMQKATWGKISAFWTYHPDNGVNISFNSK
jgi:hypothetical protein